MKPIIDESPQTHVEFDATTGETIVLPATDEQIAAKVEAEQIAAAEEAARVEAAAKREAVLAALAAAAGLEIDEVKDALA